jgi:hypothetical protein
MMEIDERTVTELALKLITDDLLRPEFKEYSAFHPECYFKLTESLKQALLTCYGENPDEDLVKFKNDVEDSKIGEYCYLLSHITLDSITEKQIREITPGAKADYSVKFYSEKGLLDEIRDWIDYDHTSDFFDHIIHQYAILAHLKLLNQNK